MQGEPVLVMLVEDKDDHAELVTRQMADHHIANKVIRLIDGQEALDYLFRKGKFENPESSPRPHIIFLRVYPGKQRNAFRSPNCRSVYNIT